MHALPLDQLLEIHHTELCRLVRALRPDLDEDTSDATLLAIVLPALHEAHARFDPSFGVKFWSFAYQRLRGAILDDFYRDHPLERRGRIACRLRFAALDHAPWEDRDQDEHCPEAAFAREESKARMMAELAELPTRERTVLRAVYFDGRCLDDVGGELGGHSRSWVSRLHTRALRKLEERLGK